MQRILSRVPRATRLRLTGESVGTLLKIPLCEAAVGSLKLCVLKGSSYQKEAKKVKGRAIVEVRP